MTTTRPTLAPLTGLRFLAALDVVILHCAGTPGWFPRPLVNLWTTGYVGVSLFFVLSGFILTYTYAAPDGALEGGRRRFWLARVARILPVYLAALVLAAPFFAERVGVQLSPANAGIVAVLVLTLTQAWVPQATMQWNFPSWSLSAEAFFYAVFPWLMPWTARRASRELVAIALGVWAVSLLAPALYLLTLPDGPQWGPDGYRWVTALKFNPLVRLPEFVLGVLAAHAYARGWRVSGAWGLAALATIVAVLANADRVSFVFLVGSLLAPAFALLIVALASGAGRWLGSRVMVRLGEASYALYLLHIPVAQWLVRLGVPGMALTPRPFAAFALYLVIVVTLSLLTFRYIEEPARRWIRRRAQPVAISQRVSPSA